MLVGARMLAHRIAIAMMVVPHVLLAAAVITFAQLVDVLGAHARLGNLIDDIAFAMVAMTAVHMAWIHGCAKHGLSQRRMDTCIFAQSAHGHVNQKSRNKCHEHLDSQNGCHAFQRHVLGHEHGQHLVGRRKKHRHQRSQRHNAPSVERRRHGGKATLRKDSQQGAHSRAGRSRATNRVVNALSRHVFQQFERQIRHEQKRNQSQRILAGVQYDIRNQIHAAHAPIDGFTKILSSKA